MNLTKKENIIKDGTKVLTSGFIATIQGNDSEECEVTKEGEYIDLNYYVVPLGETFDKEHMGLDDEFSVIDRENMTIEQEKKFVNDCFDAYEKEGFSNIFWTPYDALNNRIGQNFSVIRRVQEGEEDLRSLPMWCIKFEDGHTSPAYPEEIILSEMINNGYKSN